MKYIALDIGNVCIKVDHQTLCKKLNLPSLPPDLIAAAAKFESGRAPFTAILDALRGLPECADVTMEQLEEVFAAILLHPVPGMSELVSSLPERGIQPVFFSDISDRHLRQTREMFPAAAVVPYGIYSFQIGFLKPSPAMFLAFERRFGAPLLYTDDRAELIDAAQKFGWRAHRFVSADDLREKLDELAESK